MSRPEDANRTRIAIDLPLPLDVAGTLMKLVGTAYPTAQIDQSGTDGLGFGRQLVMLVDDGDRKRLPGKKRTAETLKEYAPEDPLAEGDLTSTGPDGWRFAPTEEVFLTVGSMMLNVLENEAGENYIEWGIKHPEDRSKDLVLSAAWSSGQTPHALRKEADDENARLRALLVEATNHVETSAVAEDFWTRAAPFLS